MENTLEQICSAIEAVDISLDAVEERFWKETDIEKGYDLGRLKGRFSELHTLMRVEEVAKRYYRAISIEKWKGEKKRRGYAYYCEKGKTNIIVERMRGRKERICEVDLLIKANNIPIIIETNSGRYKGGCGDTPLKKAMRYQSVETKKTALKPLLKKRPEFIFVIARDYVNMRGDLGASPSIVNRFRNNGNYVVALPEDHDVWRAEVERRITRMKVTDTPESGYQLSTAV